MAVSDKMRGFALVLHSWGDLETEQVVKLSVTLGKMICRRYTVNF